MPQGGSKKNKIGSITTKASKSKAKKPEVLRKGSRIIAPKKASAVHAKGVKMQLQKAINATIEQTVKERAVGEASSFKLMKKEMKRLAKDMKKKT